MCLQCGDATTNPKFCNRSCSAKYTNRTHPRRKWHCKRCGEAKPRPSRGAYYCVECRHPRARNHGRVDFLTMGDLRAFYKDNKYGRLNVHTMVRSKARARLKAEGRVACERCGYGKHIEAAHVVAIVDWDDSALLVEVNGPGNLVALCPNCHWELDHGMIDASDRWGARLVSVHPSDTRKAVGSSPTPSTTSIAA